MPSHLHARPSQRLPVAQRWLPVLAALMLGAGLSVQAAPSEGTSGQTVTGRSVDRADAGLRRHAQLQKAPEAPSKPTWKDLTAAQKEALRPLQVQWNSLGADRKAKWLAISKNFPRMSAAEQDKLHQRMSQWAALSRQERVQARQNYKELSNLTPEQKAAQWEAYKALSAEEKRKLASKAPAKAAGVATAKPNALPRLSKAPRQLAPSGDSTVEAGLSLDRHTLLPRIEPAVRNEPESAPDDETPADD